MKRTTRTLVVGSIASASLFMLAQPASAKPTHPHQTECVVMAGKSADHRKANPASNKWCEPVVTDTPDVPDTDTGSDTGDTGGGYEGPVYTF